MSFIGANMSYLHHPVKIAPYLKGITDSEIFKNLENHSQTSLTHYLYPYAQNGRNLFFPCSGVSRKEHSIGTYELLCIFFDNNPEHDNDNFRIPAEVAALYHDIGISAASHYTEMLYQPMLGIKNHEERARQVMKGSDIRDRISDLSCTVDEIADIIEGKNKSIGPVINNRNNPTPDTDSLNNVDIYFENYVKKNGISRMNPRKLARCLRLDGGDLKLSNRASEEYEHYKECRDRMYRTEIQGSTHTKAASILNYSIGHVLSGTTRKVLLDDGFLDLTDKEFIAYLKDADPVLEHIIGRTQQGILPVCIANIDTEKPSDGLLSIHHDLSKRYEYSNSVGEDLGKEFEPGDVTVETSKMKFERGLENLYNLRIFVSPYKVKDLSSWVKENIRTKLNSFANNYT